MIRSALAGAALAALLPSAFAQNQKITPPVAVYWMSVETNAGMGFSMPPGMGGMLPPGMQGGKRMKLDLGSSRSASGAPRAEHAIPPGVAMGASLPLVTPQVERAQSGPAERSPEQPMEPPKGRMLIYWGCGEQVRSGQPVIVDFSKMGTEQAAQAFRSRNVRRPTGPAFGRNRTFGEWPNRESASAVPEQATLVGAHTVTGNYSPEIRFSVADAHDFMAPVAFAPVARTAGGAFQVSWQAIPTAIGYFATAMGQGENQNDVVMWSSSDVQEMGHALMDYLPPAEVQRLTRERIVMSPQTTQCAVPAGIFKGEGAMFNFIAYGDEMNVVHPPRPKDPRQTWVQEYAVKVRLKSTGMTMLAEGDMSGGTRGRTHGEAPAGPGEERGAGERPARAPAPADPVQQGIDVLRGIFGR